MANTSARTLRLLSLLQTHRYWPGQELAGRLDVSVRTLRRDIDRLRELGYPVNANRGLEGGYQLAAGAALPPLVVDDDEAVALAVGMQSAIGGAVPGMEETAVRALTKVVQVMPARLRKRVEALQQVTVPMQWRSSADDTALDHALLITVAQSCRDSERLEFDYVARDETATHRRVEPHRLVSVGRRLYLVAFDLTRQDWRSFRVDRMAEPQQVRMPFRPREIPGGDPAEFVRAGLRRPSTQVVVELEVQADAEYVRSRIGAWSEVVEIDENRSRARIDAESFAWVVMGLITLEAEATVVGPPEFRDYLTAHGERLLRTARSEK
ncbi:MAG: helix-turn-helix transcriptional regulator [Propionibacteriaceae bacterium]